MTTFAPPTSPHGEVREHDAQISRVPYLPGLDGMRALAVIAVMIYHANPTWLPGGFLGVEMFFVISGYLITLLIIAERERTYRVSLVDFWKRRARRLLPALFVLLVGVTLYTALFESAALGQLRGDVIAGLFYGSNWYQLSTGLGYTSAFDFAPLRHLWSLAVEEQFYLVWPLVMVALLGRTGTRKVADVSRWLFIAAIGIAVTTALLFHPGVIGGPDATPDAYWSFGGRAISKLDFLYLGTITRAPGILLGAAFAMVWRPFALRRGPLRRKGPVLDVVAVAAFVVLVWLCRDLHLVDSSGAADARLFRGGLFAASAATVVLIAAVTHPGARADRVLGNRVLKWIGLRSYGLYLFHWPIYQAIRKLAGNKLSLREFLLAMVITTVVTELSYRLVERPVRTGSLVAVLRRARPGSATRRTVVGAGVIVVATSLFAGATLATADLRQSEIGDELTANEDATVDLTARDGVGTESGSATPDPSGGSLDDTGGATPDTSDTTPSDTATSDTTTSDTATADTVLGPAVDPTPGAPDSSTGPTSTPAASDQPPVGPAGPAGPPSPPSSPVPTSPPPPAITSLGVVSDASTISPLSVPAQGAAPSIRLIGFGDSVMLGSAEELTAHGFTVDAVQSRQFSAALPQLQAIRDYGLFGSAVVVHLGTNGSFPQSSLDEMMAILADVPIVVFVTGKADRVWIPGNNDLLRALPARYSNVTVLDWEVLGPQCPGDCFYADDIHLKSAGQAYYTDLIARLLGLS